MNDNFKLAIDQLVAQSTSTCVERLAEKYDFDVEEASRFLNDGNATSAKKDKKGTKDTKVLLPRNS